MVSDRLVAWSPPLDMFRFVLISLQGQCPEQAAVSRRGPRSSEQTGPWPLQAHHAPLRGESPHFGVSLLHVLPTHLWPLHMQVSF